MRAHLVIAVIIGCVVSPALIAQTTEAKKVTSAEGITEYRLDNGARILLFPDVSRPTVTVNLTVLVGSRHEGYGESGMAHLLEHMVFKGTPTHPNVPKALRDHAINYNGTTNYDRTNYFETMQATDENLEFGIRLEADRLVNSYVKREDLMSEMTVVRSEFEQGENSPERVLAEKVMAAAYEWHNYGKSTIGNRSDIERVPIENLQAFYRKYYQPDNVVLTVAGKFDEAKALSLFVKYFGPLKRPDRKLDATYTEEPPQDGERTVTLRRVGSFASVGAVYHIVAGPHPDYAACEVLGVVLGSSPGGRLYDALVVPKKATSIQAGAEGLHDPGVIEIGASCEPANLDAVREIMLAEVESIAKKPITPDEVEKAKRKLIKGREMLMNDSSRVAVTLSNWLSKGDWRLFFLHRDRLEKVSAEDVNRVAVQFLKRNNRTLGTFLPTEKPERVQIAGTPVLDEMFKDYKGRAAMAAGETFDPSAANIDARSKLGNIGGIKTAFLPRKTRGEAVSLDLSLRYGNEESLRGKVTAADMLGSLMLAGTKDRTRLQIQEELDRLGARLNASSTPGHVTFTITAKRSTLPEAVALLGEVLRSASLPLGEFERLRASSREGIQKSKTDPRALAGRALGRKLSPYAEDDVRYVPTIDESLARLNATTLEQIRELYSEQLCAQHGELAVVGDFDPELLKSNIQPFVTGWESKVPYRRIARRAPDNVLAEKITINTPDKPNAIFTAGMSFAMDDNDPEYAAIEMGNYVLGGGSLASRLGVRVRQKEGLSYGIGSIFNASSLDPVARFGISGICNPTNMEKVDVAVRDEMNRFLQDGVTVEELADAKKALLDGLKNQRNADGRLASMWVENLYVGRTFAYHGNLEKQISELTPAQIRDAFRKHIAVDKLVVVHAGDFKKQDSGGQ
ncbi:MAG: M16 family metallopeptidase [Gemmataceae bacterium]